MYLFKKLKSPKEELASIRLRWIQRCSFRPCNFSLPLSPDFCGGGSHLQLQRWPRSLLENQALQQRARVPRYKGFRGARMEAPRSSLVCVVSCPPLEVSLGTGTVPQSDCVTAISWLHPWI